MQKNYFIAMYTDTKNWQIYHHVDVNNYSHVWKWRWIVVDNLLSWEVAW